jgi:hypothetical protein
MPEKHSSLKINFTVAQADKQLDILTIDSNVDWDNFLDFSKWLISLLDGKLINHDLGADIHRVAFEFEGTRLFITYEDTSDSLWLALDNNNDTEVLTFIATLLNKS